MNKEEFLKPEIRSDFYVDETRKKLWYCELEIMEAFDKVCCRHDLNYFLIGGSAIGAVRHNGFIPWDDDLDIGMFRDDLDRLMKVIEKELSPRYCIEFGPVGSRVSFLLRIRDNSTTGIIVDEYRRGEGGGIFIEIYPYDRVPANRLLWKLQLFTSAQLAFMLGYRKSDRRFSGRLGLLQKLSEKTSAGKLWKWFDSNCRRYNKTDYRTVNRPGTPEYVKKRKHFDISDINETFYHEFEFTQLRIQKNYDKCLRSDFDGDYMKLPPKEKRGTHHNNIVFYDPDRPYTYYLENERLKDYFTSE